MEAPASAVGGSGLKPVRCPPEAAEAPGPLEAPESPWRPACGGLIFLFLLELEDYLFEVGIEGVALNPNRK